MMHSKVLHGFLNAVLRPLRGWTMPVVVGGGFKGALKDGSLVVQGWFTALDKRRSTNQRFDLSPGLHASPQFPAATAQVFQPHECHSIHKSGLPHSRARLNRGQYNGLTRQYLSNELPSKFIRAAWTNLPPRCDASDQKTNPDSILASRSPATASDLAGLSEVDHLLIAASS
jgi:hypothetical protein